VQHGLKQGVQAGTAGGLTDFKLADYYLRHPQSISAGLLDEDTIAELRGMPPSDGVSM